MSSIHHLTAYFSALVTEPCCLINRNAVGLKSRKADLPAGAVIEPGYTEGQTSVLNEKTSTQAEHAELTDEQAAHLLKLFRQTLDNDPNLDVDAFDAFGAVDYVLEGQVVLKENQLIDELLENSPWAEVRAVVRHYDEDLPANTIRAQIIGMLMTEPCEDRINDELDRWLRLADPVEKDCGPFLNWFNKRFEYPRLTRMAIDVLSVPLIAAECESVFLM